METPPFPRILLSPCSLDTYMSHEGVIYCKPHHRELFQPKVVQSDLVDVTGQKNRKKKMVAEATGGEGEVAEGTQEAIGEGDLKILIMFCGWRPYQRPLCAQRATGNRSAAWRPS